MSASLIIVSMKVTKESLVPAVLELAIAA